MVSGTSDKSSKETGGSNSGACSGDETSSGSCKALVLAMASDVSQTFVIFDCGSSGESDVTADPAFRLTAALRD